MRKGREAETIRMKERRAAIGRRGTSDRVEEKGSWANAGQMQRMGWRGGGSW